MSIKDSQFRASKVERHPMMEPHLRFNDIKGQGTIYFKSYYDESPEVKRLVSLAPHLYYPKELPENKIITLKEGAYARFPHSYYTIHALDDTSGRRIGFSYLDESRL